MDIRSTVAEFILQNFLFGEKSGFPDDAESFLELGIIDSTGILELVAFIEIKFGIKVEDEELLPENLDSIENLTRYIETKITEGVSHVGS